MIGLYGLINHMQLNFATKTLIFKTNSYFFCLVMDRQIVSVSMSNEQPE